MLTLKPFIRITILSMILATLLILVGVKYHWGDYLKSNSDSSIKLAIPDEITTNVNIETTVIENSNNYDPEIVKNNTVNKQLSSMNKEQITEQCINLLSRDLKDPLILELATVNCVVSNHQPTFQNSQKLSNELEISLNKKKLLLRKQCNNQYIQNTQYSLLEKKLLVGICISDKLSSNN